MNLITVLSKKAILSSYVHDEIKHGAHVILQDNGSLYEEWHARGTERVICQHKSAKNVFDVPASSGTILMGLTHSGHTWVQWERSAYCTCSHAADWLIFVFSRRNQGPEGTSSRTDENPIVLRAMPV